MSVSLFFVRHAKPAQQGVLLGHTDSLLAEPIVSTSFAEHLKAQPVQRVISSPLLRAKDTAALLFPLLPVVIDEQLKECNFGLWDGKPIRGCGSMRRALGIFGKTHGRPRRQKAKACVIFQVECCHFSAHCLITRSTGIRLW
jgi:hypothetical protein